MSIACATGQLPARGKVQQAIAEIDKRHAVIAAMQFNREPPAIKFECRVYIAGFEGDLIDADGEGFARCGYILPRLLLR